MTRRLHIPLRVKLMLAFLVLVTVVLGVNTFSTANLFQEDKQAYINGLTSMVVLGTAEEARSTLAGYRERLQLYARLLLEVEMSERRREETARTLFEEFPELIAATAWPEGQDPISVVNASRLEAAGLTPADMTAAEKEHPLPEKVSTSGQPFVRNTTFSDRLPCFTLAFKQEIAGEERPVLVTAVLSSERLQKLMARFSAYAQFLVDSEGTVLVASDAATSAERRPADLPAEATSVRNSYSAGLTVEYEAAGVETIGGFADVDFANVIAGASIPHSAAHLASKRLVSRLLVMASVLLAAAIALGFVGAYGVTRPVERLSDATRTIAEGNFDVAVDVDSRDEMGDLAASFNQMALGLKARDEKLRTAQAQLVQSEKMAAFGQLGAGIAHEVKNPLAGILSCAQLAAEDVDEGSQVHGDLKLIEKEARRCKTIIDNLLKFARQERAEMSSIDLNEIIEDSIAIVRHQMEINGVKVECDLGADLPPIHGNANQLEQVFINLMINAQQAMDGTRGTIRVTSRVTGGGSVEARFADTGPGIPDEIRARIFEPFFTTKPAGKGTGLGLSVSYGIVKDHRGEITIDSVVGRGTTFILAFPPATEGAGRSDPSVSAATVGAGV